MHIHLDALGGISGDMFAAAMLDARSDLTASVLSALQCFRELDKISVDVVSHNDGVLTGTRFIVSDRSEADLKDRPHSSGHDLESLQTSDITPAHEILHHDHNNDVDSAPSGRAVRKHHRHHRHVHWRDIRKSLRDSKLKANVKTIAIGIFGMLARAEAKVHNTDLDAVTFHEVGSWDSIADVVAAAVLIDEAGAQTWSVSSLPIGGGWVDTEHGRIPVPAPATMILLNGFSFHDDGRAGERVTPTGAAILSYLKAASSIPPGSQILQHVGTGFGTRRLEGMSNILRVLEFEHNDRLSYDNVGIIQFEVDDQSGEELACSLDHIRASADVIDVIQTAAFGKKGRMVSAIQILAKPQALEAVAELCFQQTTTLGMRTRLESRVIVPRDEVATSEGARVKLARRPGGLTAKTEMDDVALDARGHQRRVDRRRIAEHEALKTDRKI